MFSRIKEGKISIKGGAMYYLSFGRGVTPLVIIPGLNDGLRTVKGSGLIMAFFYRIFARQYRVWVFSRMNELKHDMTTRDMAAHQAEAMDHLGLKKTMVMGVSQGGMIAQWLAIDHPEKIRRLVLAITLARQSETLKRIIGSWIDMVLSQRFGELAVDMMEKNFTDKYLRRIRPFYWVIKRTGKPVSKERFLIQARSCLSHDAYHHLNQICSPTLVIGGGDDQILGGAEVQEELASVIPSSALKVYHKFGHGAYAEEPDFNVQVLDFLGRCDDDDRC